jgi:hypothetical protein
MMTLAAGVLILKSLLDLILKFVPRHVTIITLGVAAVALGANKLGTDSQKSSSN